MLKGNCIVGQSGGPTCVINSSLLGVIKEALKHKEIENVYGALNGINGVINDNLVNLSNLDEENKELLKQTPSAILGSVRHCLSDDFSNPEYEKILNNLKKHNVRYFFYIGGNDSMDTVSKLSTYFKMVDYECYVIGVPKTIDNDLVGTDHTPGYGSACKFISNTVHQLIEDTNCYHKGRVTVVEIMGRDTGWLTACSKLASLNGNNPDLIYLPEVTFDVEKFLKKVDAIYKKKKKVLVCISEGIRDKDGNLFVGNVDNDVFGHAQLGGAALTLTNIVKERLNLSVRAIEFNLLQRCASTVSSSIDINEAIGCGRYAVKQAILKNTGKMVTMNRISDDPYKITYSLKDIKEIANQTKYFPKEWIVNGCDISDEFIKYALPLMSKEHKGKYANGILKFASIESLKK
ncbi:MAG: 6-phosphofructokinase [Bacilli bacterium]|nr:6-phosphofructokinase [Bacilli bacterium]